METIAVILIVGTAGILILRSFVRSLRGKGRCRSCLNRCEAERRNKPVGADDNSGGVGDYGSYEQC